jgi:hypothetical protein
VLRELALEGVDFLRPLVDAVVAEEVLAANHPLEGLELLIADFHAAGEHGALRTGSGRGPAVACQTQLGLSDRHRRPPSGEPILDIAAAQRNRLLNRLRRPGQRR